MTGLTTDLVTFLWYKVRECSYSVMMKEKNSVLTIMASYKHKTEIMIFS